MAILRIQTTAFITYPSERKHLPQFDCWKHHSFVFCSVCLPAVVYIRLCSIPLASDTTRWVSYQNIADSYCFSLKDLERTCENLCWKASKIYYLV